MLIFEVSEESVVLQTENCDNINIFMQYFIHSNQNRHKEIRTCLIKNVLNKSISKIYLLNERIYTKEELGIDSNKIVQVNIKNRLKYADVFRYINEHSIKGYNIFMNSDIFLDETISNLQKTDIHLNKKMYALLRYECVNLDKYKESKLFGPRADSQDTWIIHSNFNVTNEECKIFNFEFGKPGCDNKLIYLMKTLGYNVLNEPDFIRTYHLHNTQIRNYTQKDIINKPYAFVIPKKYLNCQIYYDDRIYNNNFNCYSGNKKIKEYLQNKIKNNENFIIPSISDIEVEVNYASFLLLCEISNNEQQQKYFKYFKENLLDLKEKACINISNLVSVKNFSKLYFEAFNNCDLYANWAPFDDYFKTILTSHNTIDNICQNKEKINIKTFNIFNFIHLEPWTLELKRQKILVISLYDDTINDKMTNNTGENIYNINLFPNCEIITINLLNKKEINEFDKEYEKMCEKIDEINEKYDIALVSCKGCGNIISNYIYQKGKSAINIGDNLNSYWGLFDTKMLSDYPDIIRLYLNSEWKKI